MHELIRATVVLAANPVRVRWDPERDPHHRPLNYRSSQIGLGEESAERYVDEWILSIKDIASMTREVGHRHW